MASLEISFLCGSDFSSACSKNYCRPNVCQVLFLVRKDVRRFQPWRASVFPVWTIVMPVTSIFHPKQHLTLLQLPHQAHHLDQGFTHSTQLPCLVDWKLSWAPLLSHLYPLIALEAKFILQREQQQMKCPPHLIRAHRKGEEIWVWVFAPAVKSRLCSLKSLELHWRFPPLCHPGCVTDEKCKCLWISKTHLEENADIFSFTSGQKQPQMDLSP